MSIPGASRDKVCDSYDSAAFEEGLTPSFFVEMKHVGMVA